MSRSSTNPTGSIVHQMDKLVERVGFTETVLEIALAQVRRERTEIEKARSLIIGTKQANNEEQS